MKKKDILFILILTLICVVTWIGFNIYHSAEQSTISSEEANQIIPISPNFDTKIINQLKNRERVEPLYQNAPTLTVSPTITPKPTLPSESASESALNTTGSNTK